MTEGLNAAHMGLYSIVMVNTSVGIEFAELLVVRCDMFFLGRGRGFNAHELL
jgi:hypothetical protein